MNDACKLSSSSSSRNENHKHSGSATVMALVSPHYSFIEHSFLIITLKWHQVSLKQRYICSTLHSFTVCKTFTFNVRNLNFVFL